MFLYGRFVHEDFMLHMAVERKKCEMLKSRKTLEASVGYTLSVRVQLLAQLQLAAFSDQTYERPTVDFCFRAAPQ